jgi:hypothetical protein
LHAWLPHASLQGIEQVEAPLAPTLGLTMMVKNEADFIVQTLNSTKPFIDHWTIVDTGGLLGGIGKSSLLGAAVCPLQRRPTPRSFQTYAKLQLPVQQGRQTTQQSSLRRP